MYTTIKLYYDYESTSISAGYYGKRPKVKS